MKKQFAVLKNVEGKSGKDSLIAWAGVPFETFDTKEEALKECARINKIYLNNGLPNRANAYVSNMSLIDLF